MKYLSAMEMAPAEREVDFADVVERLRISVQGNQERTRFPDPSHFEPPSSKPLFMFADTSRLIDSLATLYRYLFQFVESNRWVSTTERQRFER